MAFGVAAFVFAKFYWLRPNTPSGEVFSPIFAPITMIFVWSNICQSGILY